MQSLHLRCDPSVDNPHPLDLPTMPDEPSSPIHPHDEPQRQQQQQPPPHSENNHNSQNKSIHNGSNTGNNNIVRKERPSRACTARAAARLYAAAAAEAAVAERRQKAARKERVREKSPEPSRPQPPQCQIITPLAVEPPPSHLPRWSLRSMWELASILNFLNVFRPFLNIKVEFSAEEFETALITPNNTLGDIHIPLLKAIPPITRMALGHNTWITVLCRKLRDWWHWVAGGELPIVASHGAEVEAYNSLDPGVRVVILKALCDIRVEQEDIRNYIDDSIKHGVQLSAFRKERIGGDSYGISYWYEDDSIIGHRLYREIRKVEVKKVKGKNVQPIPSSSYQWETVATNLDEFQDVSLTALLAEVGLNIQEAHAFSTVDGYSLDVFVVDGWPYEEIEQLRTALEKELLKIEVLTNDTENGKALYWRGQAYKELGQLELFSIRTSLSHSLSTS